MTKTRDKAYRGISPVRDADGKVVAFLVRRTRNKKEDQVYVGVATHKTVEAAYAFAEGVRDKHDEKYGKNAAQRASAATLSQATSRSSTRIRGVAHCHHPHKITGAIYESYQAQWPRVSGKPGVKKYSIGERKAEDALLLARKARENGVRQYLRDLQGLK